jgi:hypothetical protein
MLAEFKVTCASRSVKGKNSSSLLHGRQASKATSDFHWVIEISGLNNVGFVDIVARRKTNLKNFLEHFCQFSICFLFVK